MWPAKSDHHPGFHNRTVCRYPCRLVNRSISYASLADHRSQEAFAGQFGNHERYTPAGHGTGSTPEESMRQLLVRGKVFGDAHSMVPPIQSSLTFTRFRQSGSSSGLELLDLA